MKEWEISVKEDDRNPTKQQILNALENASTIDFYSVTIEGRYVENAHCKMRITSYSYIGDLPHGLGLGAPMIGGTIYLPDGAEFKVSGVYNTYRQNGHFRTGD